MSASAKLRALDEAARPFWDEDSKTQDHIIAANRCVDALVDALPQIVAVVEAAESLLERIKHFGPTERREAEIHRALRALEEALS